MINLPSKISLSLHRIININVVKSNLSTCDGARHFTISHYANEI